MRAKFVVEIGAVSPSAFPSDEAFVDRLLILGLGRTANEAVLYEDRRKTYLEEAEKEWQHLPEVAEGERDFVIFFARLPDHCRLMVTRRLEGYATFRLIHDSLGELEKNAEWIIGELRKKSGAVMGLNIQDDRIEIYERGLDHVILLGQAIHSPIQEAARQNTATLVSAAVTGLASIMTLLMLAFLHIPAESLARGTIERFSTAMIASFFIAVVSFVQAWWQLARIGGVDWRPAFRRTQSPMH